MFCEFYGSCFFGAWHVKVLGISKCFCAFHLLINSSLLLCWVMPLPIPKRF
uniref:Uncharacterized protein n=1 Tax=Rhizophora mucronata TaxID=61149 RepID=A0A2P2NM70_RHIMU